MNTDIEFQKIVFGEMYGYPNSLKAITDKKFNSR